jgi:aldehyde dehydrogenase (NAD+)
MYNIPDVVEAQRKFFNSGKTLDVNFRIEQLKKLKKTVKLNEEAILAALKADLNKPDFEAYSTEIMQIIGEIKYTCKHLKNWAKPKRVNTPLVLQPGKSKIYRHPFGVVLNIAPWNYPFQICLVPLVSILAAGNCAIIKPSELAPHSSKLIAGIIGDIFPPEYCTVIEGEVEKTQELLSQKWDFIAFTGSTEIGKIIAQSAAKNLTPTLLELGGKSPCIVHDDANIKVAARRIVWGKFLNAGQTCTAVDFIVAEKSIVKKLIDEIILNIKIFYSDNAIDSPDLCRIINKKHFERLYTLIANNDKIIYGGRTDKNSLYIEPTLIYKTNWSDKIMEEEIFGPLLPIIEYENIHTVVDILKEKERPLALYLFSENKHLQNEIIKKLNFGGGCINATIMHNGSTTLPFGGVGDSGNGRYNGKSGFDTFTYEKSIFYKSCLIDPKLPYPPYKQKVNILKKLT